MNFNFKLNFTASPLSVLHHHENNNTGFIRMLNVNIISVLRLKNHELNYQHHPPDTHLSIGGQHRDMVKKHRI